jgi:hypothetical protein
MLSAHSLVLAAPVPVGEAGAVEGGEEMITASGELAARGGGNPGSSKSVSWDPTTKVHFYTDTLNLPPPPGQKGYQAKMAQQPSSSTIEDVSSPSFFEPPPLPPPPGREGYLAKVSGEQSSSESKGLLSKLGKLKFRPRF